MKRKRGVTLLLAAMIASTCLTGCGDEGGTQSTESSMSTTGGTDFVEETNESEMAESDTQSDTTMVDARSLTDDQVAEYAEILFTAVQNLDIETLKNYTEEDDDSVEVLEKIAAAPEYQELWEKTVGQMIYLPKSSVILAKSPSWLFSKWYTIKAEENAEIPDSVRELTLEEVNEFYDTYYDACPYVAGKLSRWEIEPYNDEDTGKLLFDIEQILVPVGFSELEASALLNRSDYGKYGVYLFDDQSSLGLGYDYLGQEDQIPVYQDLLSMDLDKLVEIVESSNPPEDHYYYGYYVQYYKDEANRAIIQEWMNENCVVLRTLSSVEYFYTANLDYDYPADCIVRDERELVKDLNIVNNEPVLWFPREFGEFSAFYQIAKSLIDRGLLPEYVEYTAE